MKRSISAILQDHKEGMAEKIAAMGDDPEFAARVKEVFKDATRVSRALRESENIDSEILHRPVTI